MPEILEEKIEEPVVEVVETNVTAKQIITGLIATAVIAGGVIVGFKDKTPPKMSYDEAQKLIDVYNHELKQSPDKTLAGINNDNIIQKMNDKFSKRDVKTEEVLDGENVNPSDYLILRSGLMLKALNK